MSSTKTSHATLAIEDLIALLGQKQALRLCKLYGGRKLPMIEHYLRGLRRRAIIADCLAGHDLHLVAARYRLTYKHVVTVWTEYVQTTGTRAATGRRLYALPTK